MAFTIVAVALGVVAALVAGGRTTARVPTIRALPLLTAGAALQALTVAVDVEGGLGMAAIAASYALLLAFAVRNVHLVGMPVVLVGLVLNALVIGVNGGMPVRGEAILAVDDDLTADDLHELEFGTKRHLEDDGDELTFLGDIVPVPLLGQVLSFGDLIMSAGMANVVFRLLRPASTGE